MGNTCCEQTSLPSLPDSFALKSHGILNYEPSSEPTALSPAVQSVINQLDKLDNTNKFNTKEQPAMKHKTEGYIYVGHWQTKGERPEGPGKMYFENGAYFEGEFKQGQANGHGRYISPEGHYYEGNVVNNKASGIGKFKCEEYEFNGQWQESKPTIGEYRLKNGTYVRLQQPTNGTILFANKNKYTGQIRNFNPEGRGAMSFQNGNRYEGQWKAGKMHGFGQFLWTDGTSYVGQYVNGLKEGTGTFKYNKEDRYEGHWVGGKQNGEGSVWHNDHLQFKGIFKEGKPSTEPVFPPTPISKLD